MWHYVPDTMITLARFFERALDARGAAPLAIGVMLVYLVLVFVRAFGRQ